jgi:hypothetical protein
MAGWSGILMSAAHPPSNKSPEIAAAARMIRNFPKIEGQLLHTNRG